jgi:osomolarity two-component system, response regulator SSK1
MGVDIKARIRAKFSRKNSAAPSLASTNSDSHNHHPQDELATPTSQHTAKHSSSPSRPPSIENERRSFKGHTDRTDHDHDDDGPRGPAVMDSTEIHIGEAESRSYLSAPMSPAVSGQRLASDALGSDLRNSTATTNLPSINEHSAFFSLTRPFDKPANPAAAGGQYRPIDGNDPDLVDPHSPGPGTPTPVAAPTAIPPNLTSTSSFAARPAPVTAASASSARRQSLLPNRQTILIKTLLQAAEDLGSAAGNPESLLPTINANMMTRKIWVKRPGASATLITINEDDLVDDVREMILKKYLNSLGRHFDSPDLTIRIAPREARQDRILGPEEPMGRTLDAYYPGGQSVDEALIIDVPHRRTPKPSPRPGLPHHGNAYHGEDGRPSENGEGYFPPIPAIPSPHLPVTAQPIPNGVSAPHSISVLGTGQIPPIPSPGGTRSRAYRERPERPRLGRTHTSSPTVLGGVVPASVTAATLAANHGTLPSSLPILLFRPRTHSNVSDQAPPPPAAPPLPTPPAPEPTQQRVATPPPRVASPRPSTSRPKKSKKTMDHPTLPPGMLNGSVPPINVLIVEDNPINLKLLEAFVKRLKVRWQSAMNGRDAVTKWRTGGFHLVLMDIQLPVMNGLDATREIRRLERVNSIGVFSSAASSVPDDANGGDLEDKDRLVNTEMFKSPVIIVALTASSLQSDRHEALAAGCNDFLTKVCSLLAPSSPP